MRLFQFVAETKRSAKESGDIVEFVVLSTTVYVAPVLYFNAVSVQHIDSILSSSSWDCHPLAQKWALQVHTSFWSWNAFAVELNGHSYVPREAMQNEAHRAQVAHRHIIQSMTGEYCLFYVFHRSNI